MTASAKKIWFITGVSSGFGRALAEQLVAAGHRVVGTVRDEAARGSFEALAPGLAIGRLLDVTQHAEASRAVGEVERTVGPIDVLVNNAGYGHAGTIEETTIEEFKQQFDVNVFGAVSMIQAVLPFMRERRRGHILNVTSMGGIVTFPGMGVYHGSKFALEGISETLGKEVAGFGIRVITVEPGGFRTDWAGRSMRHSAETIADYVEPMRARREAIATRHGTQPGDPVKAARAMIEITEAESPPAHLLLGSDALGMVREKLAGLQQQIDQWEVLTKSTDIAAAGKPA